MQLIIVKKILMEIYLGNAYAIMDILMMVKIIYAKNAIIAGTLYTNFYLFK